MLKLVYNADTDPNRKPKKILKRIFGLRSKLEERKIPDEIAHETDVNEPTLPPLPDETFSENS